jgi:hypothetical protein
VSDITGRIVRFAATPKYDDSEARAGERRRVSCGTLARALNRAERLADFRDMVDFQ